MSGNVHKLDICGKIPFPVLARLSLFSPSVSVLVFTIKTVAQVGLAKGPFCGEHVLPVSPKVGSLTKNKTKLEAVLFRAQVSARFGREVTVASRCNVNGKKVPCVL